MYNSDGRPVGSLRSCGIGISNSSLSQLLRALFLHSTARDFKHFYCHLSSEVALVSLELYLGKVLQDAKVQRKVQYNLGGLVGQSGRAGDGGAYAVRRDGTWTGSEVLGLLPLMPLLSCTSALSFSEEHMLLDCRARDSELLSDGHDMKGDGHRDGKKTHPQGRTSSSRAGRTRADGWWCR